MLIQNFIGKLYGTYSLQHRYIKNEKFPKINLDFMLNLLKFEFLVTLRKYAVYLTLNNYIFVADVLIFVLIT